MEFTNLMLLHTSALYWAPRPTYNPQQLREFLRFLLSPDMPGLSLLGIPTDGRRARQWLSGQDALKQVDQVYERVWHPGGLLVERFGEEAKERVFHSFVEHKAELFLNSTRFRACLSELGHQAPDEGVDFYIGFSIDWSYVGDSLLWSPQLRISNFWPSYRRLAPPPPDGVPSPSPMSAMKAAEVLEHLFWRRIETDFRRMRYAFDLGEADVKLGDLSYEAPVFYYAEPTALPAKPEEFLESPPYLAALERLCRVALGTDDPKSADVMGGVLEGNLLTLRRERVGQHSVRSYYLLIPWWSGDRSSSLEEVERGASFVADKLFFLDFAAGFESYELLTALPMPQERIAVWKGSVNLAGKLTSQLSNLIAYEPAGSLRKKEAFRLNRELRVILARMETEMLRVTDDVMGLVRAWERDVESGVRYAKEALTSRPLAAVCHLVDGLGEFFAYRVSGKYTRQAAQAAERAKQLRETYDSVESVMKDLLEQEEREEREREERLREEEQERQEKRQRALGYWLAVLAAIAAFPIIIGQLNWAELQQVISQWPKAFQGVSEVLEAVHPYLVLVAIISAAAVITCLISLLVWTGLRGRVLTKGSSQRRATGSDEKEWRRIGAEITRVWQLVKRSEETVWQVREKAFVSNQIGDGESDGVLALRQRVDRWDQEVCQRLAEIWDWLTQTRKRVYGTPAEDELEWLKSRVQLFIVEAELLVNRPTPFPFPVGLCLFRHKSTDFVGSTVVCDFECEQILNGFGFRDSEVRAIDRWAEQPLSTIKGYEDHELAHQGKCLKDLPAREFVQVLREVVGVSALHERAIKDPIQESRLAR